MNILFAIKANEECESYIIFLHHLPMIKYVKYVWIGTSRHNRSRILFKIIYEFISQIALTLNSGFPLLVIVQSTIQLINYRILEKNSSSHQR